MRNCPKCLGPVLDLQMLCEQCRPSTNQYQYNIGQWGHAGCGTVNSWGSSEVNIDDIYELARGVSNVGLYVNLCNNIKTPVAISLKDRLILVSINNQLLPELHVEDLCRLCFLTHCDLDFYKPQELHNSELFKILINYLHSIDMTEPANDLAAIIRVFAMRSNSDKRRNYEIKHKSVAPGNRTSPFGKLEIAYRDKDGRTVYHLKGRPMKDFASVPINIIIDGTNFVIELVSNETV
jgi:hypothetical protein